MSDHIRDAGRSPTTGGDATKSFNYPYAAAPDIIRSNQKDAYFQSVLLTQLSAVIRSIYGTRAEHKWNSEASVFTEMLYLGLTTFLGNRTLGEEYCDIVQIETDTHRLPSLIRRSGYILSSVLLPYILTRFLPAFRKRLRAKLEVKLRKAHHRRVSSPSRMKNPPTKRAQFQDYVLKNIDTLTSPAPVYAVSLAIFYFSGAYYQLSKRLFGLRYVFTRKLEESDQRAGYEVLGVLLVVQMVVQGYLHVNSTYQNVQLAPGPSPTNAFNGGSAVIEDGIEIGTENNFSTPLLFEPAPQGTDPEVIKKRVAQVTHTPLVAGGKGHRHDLKNEEVMQWIEGDQGRKCTLCLEAMRDPSVTTCGHVFCWTCVTDWLREQPMCPLCRQGALVQHVLPLRG
ncbi:related to C3HC4 zinc-binding integral peroxisomal membrane protein [Ramularia collo-cygni]|uniref:RING-type E3 ubiquitin transferase n=1 Tax=Ramularia collo-cygni TaxID=112498 RepID=A0A2D3UZ32_9PEZI|nr:related to C3HC4 zinc-binding integral peroxisomal membrane protein [Ramularia collo-cygni]CZT18470.1 related to C3HC4 zinc-binding integral peroxisomal membrane protein [Ramularia collo-cygni]